MRKNKTTQNRCHEGISPTLEEFVDPELEAAMKGKGRAKDFVLAEDQEKDSGADAEQGESITIASVGV